MTGDGVSDSARAIENLVVSYAQLVDSGDFDALGALLAEAAFGGDTGGTVTGARAIAELFRSMVRVYDDGTPRTKHVTTNIRVDVDEANGTADSESYVTVFQALPGMALQPIVAGRYRDRFERRAGEWRFAERRFTTDLVGDVSRHLLVDPGVLGPRA